MVAAGIGGKGTQVGECRPRPPTRQPPRPESGSTERSELAEQRWLSPRTWLPRTELLYANLVGRILTKPLSLLPLFLPLSPSSPSLLLPPLSSFFFYLSLITLSLLLPLSSFPLSPSPSLLLLPLYSFSLSPPLSSFPLSPSPSLLLLPLSSSLLLPPLSPFPLSTLMPWICSRTS